MFLLSVKDSTSSATAADLRDYLGVLMEHKFYELAYYAWLQFLPLEQLNSAGLQWRVLPAANSHLKSNSPRECERLIWLVAPDPDRSRSPPSAQVLA